MFPIITYKATNTELDEALQNLVERKFSGLEKYFTEGDEITCAVEFEKETAHQSGRHFRVESNLNVAGQLFRAEATEENFEMAIDEVQAELDKLLRRANDKKGTLLKCGGRMVKKLMMRS